MDESSKGIESRDLSVREYFDAEGIWLLDHLFSLFAEFFCLVKTWPDNGKLKISSVTGSSY